MIQGRRAPLRVALAPGYLLAAPLALPLPAPLALGRTRLRRYLCLRLWRWGGRAFGATSACASGAGANAPSALGRTRLRRWGERRRWDERAFNALLRRVLHPPSSAACGKIVGGIGSRKRERVGTPSVSGPA